MENDQQLPILALLIFPRKNQFGIWARIVAQQTWLICASAGSVSCPIMSGKVTRVLIMRPNLGLILGKIIGLDKDIQSYLLGEILSNDFKSNEMVNPAGLDDHIFLT